MEKEALDIASDHPPDEALNCRRRPWDVPYNCGEWPETPIESPHLDVPEQNATESSPSPPLAQGRANHEVQTVN